MPPFKKGEKITDQTVLDRLAAARAKALEVRKAKKQAKADEKLVADLEKKQKEAEVKEKLDNLTKPKNKPVDKGKEAESEPEEEEIVVVKKKPKKPKKKVVYVQESDNESLDDDEEAYNTPSVVAPSIESQPDPREVELERMYQATYGRRKLKY
jgi:hypothetical protein